MTNDVAPSLTRVFTNLQRLNCKPSFRIPGKSIRSLCPAHRDMRHSLCATHNPDKNGTQVKCFAGCTRPQIVQALGLQTWEMYDGPRPPRERPTIVASYDYHDPDGVLIARKVRFVPKAFRWQRRDPSARGGWSWDFKGLDEGAKPGLYRRPSLTGAPLVYVVEGEKAVERLIGLGLVATCGMAGASGWKHAWSQDLQSAGCRAVVVLADHDPPGARHAERIAADLRETDATIVVKVVRLPALVVGGDVVDWLEGGHDVGELVALVEQTAVWTPGADARQRAERRKLRHRERMRNYRTAHRAEKESGVIANTTALDTVLTLLDGADTPQSGRAIKKALAGAHPRRVIERAMIVGVETGVLVADGDARRGYWKHYRRAAPLPQSVPSVPAPRLTHVTDSGTLAPKCPSVPHEKPPISAIFPNEMPLSHESVMPCACAQGVITSLTLQDTTLPRLTHVTDSGTLPPRLTRITDSGTLRNSSSAEADKAAFQATFNVAAEPPSNKNAAAQTTAERWAAGRLPTSDEPPFGISREAWRRNHGNRSTL